MTEDFLRTMYRCNRIFSNDTEGEPGQWYEVPPDRLTLPYESAFMSRVWDDSREDYALVGETARLCCGARNLDWRDGSAPAVFAGGPPCGGPNAWAGTPVPGEDPFFFTNDIGQPPCCQVGGWYIWTGGSEEGGSWPSGSHVEQWTGGSEEGGIYPSSAYMDGEGGLALGGAAPMRPGGGGPPCPIGSTYTVVIAGIGGTAPCVSLNGTWTMTHVTAQTWQRVGTPTATLNLAGPTYILTLSAFPVNAVWHAASFNCSTGGTFTLFSSSGVCTGAPATVTVSSP